MEKEVISYLDRKEDVYSWMNAQKPDINPISYGSSYVFYELGDVDNLRLCEYFIACGLFELEHHDLEERIEEQMTYWIYQYEHFERFKGEIPDCELLERDIEKIKSMMTLRFEDLECYETEY